MKRTDRLEKIYEVAILMALNLRHEFLTPEHVLCSFFESEIGLAIEQSYRYNPGFSVPHQLQEEMLRMIDKVEGTENYDLEVSSQLMQVMEWSEMLAHAAGKSEVDIPHFIQSIINLDDSQARYILLENTTTDVPELLSTLLSACNGETLPQHVPVEENPSEDVFDFEDPFENPFEEPARERTGWRELVTCINDQLASHNPLIGRDAELDRTIQVLCRKEKNNPLHVGEPGVGKTALVYGLAERIERGEVPSRLRGARIYQMDMGSMVAGTSYRGDFEKRIKAVMDGVLKEGNAIVYIDEIHTLIGSGAGGQDSLDGSNMLKPYLESGDIRFIGSTTYQEYNRYFQKSRGLVRRFQQIDVPEPSQEETVRILEGLKEKYESYHGVRYDDGVMEYAVSVSARYIHGRFLPDKAIDLIDEAGAYREMHPQVRRYKGKMRPTSVQRVDKELINDVLARVCRIDPRSFREEDNMSLESLSDRMKGEIFGQDAAIQRVVEAVQMGKAGLLEEGKPVASLLFVGPTGVGKTEVCRALARQLGIELVRFDMSEYAEKHAVAKLIGSPAGYVGYEDGGLLTDAIRKTPHCVLLLDEIEKAHADIYNILLQVMDYARLTDNKGQQADFRHVILVLTSNAGAQYAHQASIGFGSSVSAGEAMLATVRKTFKPEFMARLSDTVVFRDMDEEMASRILDKKLSQLSQRLQSRKVAMTLTPDARTLLLSRGYNVRLGAREMDRQINQMLSPLLTRAILFGELRKGGVALVDVKEESLFIREVHPCRD